MKRKDGKRLSTTNFSVNKLTGQLLRRKRAFYPKFPWFFPPWFFNGNTKVDSLGHWIIII